MSTEPTPGLDDTLKTSELQARLEVDLGLIVNARTIRHWVERPDNPCPVAYKGKNGQAHRFRWVDFLTWYDAEQERQLAMGRAPGGHAETESDIDQLDWHSARTISARERAKKDIIETRRLEGKYVDASAVERTAQDRALEASNMVRAMASRLAPVLVGKDELEMYRLLDADARLIHNALERSALAAIPSDDDPDDPPNEKSIDDNQK